MTVPYSVVPGLEDKKKLEIVGGEENEIKGRLSKQDTAYHVPLSWRAQSPLTWLWALLSEVYIAWCGQPENPLHSYLYLNAEFQKCMCCPECFNPLLRRFRFVFCVAECSDSSCPSESGKLSSVTAVNKNVSVAYQRPIKHKPTSMYLCQMPQKCSSVVGAWCLPHSCTMC